MFGSWTVGALARHGKWLALAATMMAFALSAAPASAIMVKLPNGRYANYDALNGAKAPAAARNFDQMFTNLDYSGGPIMPSNTNYIVEWQPSNYSGTAFQGPDVTGHIGYVPGVQKFFTDMAHDTGLSTNSDAVSTQYNDTSGAHAAYSFSYAGTLLDTDPLPANGCSSGTICITDAQIQTELNSYLGAHGVSADLTHEYYLLTPPDVVSCFDSAGTQCSGQASSGAVFCAYHSMTPHGYVYSNIPDLSGVSGCDPFVDNWFNCPSFSCSYNNGPADGVLSAVSHEHNESITDPEPNNAWTDWGSSVGGEIGDKCNNDGFSDPNQAFGGPGGDAPYNETINGGQYLIQREWSNQTKACLDSFSANGTTASASFSMTSTSGSSGTFSAAGSSSNPGGVAEYVWQFNDGAGGSQVNTQESSSPTITHTFAHGAGSYTVALTVMNNDGTSNGTAHVVHVGFVAPTAAFTAGSGGENAAITFDGSGSSDPNAGGSLSYAWNFGDGGTASGAVVSHAFHAGFYNVALTVTDSASSLTSTVSHSVFVPDEVPSAGFSAPGGTAGLPDSFAGSGSDSDGSITTYAWTFGDGSSGSGANANHTYASAGTYSVTLKVTDSAGQSASTTHAVTIAPACVVPKVKGDSLSKARTVLGNARCAVGKITSPKKPKHGAGRHKKWVRVVASSNPARGTIKPQGSNVALTLVWKAVHV